MHLAHDIAEKWMERMILSAQELSAALRVTQPDPFRNPVGYTIRRSLTQLVEQLLGDMDAHAIDAALDAIVRIRAVQDVTLSQALGFVIQLRSVLQELPETPDLVRMDSRIDQLAQAAFDKYMQCREQIVLARIHETERLTRRSRYAGKVHA